MAGIAVGNGLGFDWRSFSFSSCHFPSSFFFVGAYRIPRIRKIRRRAFDS
jgi:hypothetical protein